MGGEDGAGPGGWAAGGSAEGGCAAEGGGADAAEGLVAPSAPTGASLPLAGTSLPAAGTRSGGDAPEACARVSGDRLLWAAAGRDVSGAAARALRPWKNKYQTPTPNRTTVGASTPSAT